MLNTLYDYLSGIKLYSRIITFGCSNTFGQGLSDCLHAKPGDKASKLAWPSVLGRLYNRPVVNCAIPGASNLEILYTIANTKITATDLVIVLWTHLERWTKINNGKCMQIGTWRIGKEKKPVSATYYKYIQSECTDKFLYPVIIREADRIIKQTNTKNYHIELYKTNLFPFTCLDIDMVKLRKIYPLAEDKNHIGLLAHEHLARKIYEQTNLL